MRFKYMQHCSQFRDSVRSSPSPVFPPSVMGMLSLPAVKTPAGHWRSWLIRIWTGHQFVWNMLREHQEQGVALQEGVCIVETLRRNE